MLVVGFFADPDLAKGIFVDLALASSVGASKEPDTTCKFQLDECAGSRREFVVTPGDDDCTCS